MNADAAPTRGPSVAICDQILSRRQMSAEQFHLHNAEGLQLAALLDCPSAPARAVALFPHRFSCGKAQHGPARRIAKTARSSTV